MCVCVYTCVCVDYIYFSRFTIDLLEFSKHKYLSLYYYEYASMYVKGDGNLIPILRPSDFSDTVSVWEDQIHHNV